MMKLEAELVSEISYTKPPDDSGDSLVVQEIKKWQQKWKEHDPSVMGRTPVESELSNNIKDHLYE